MAETKISELKKQQRLVFSYKNKKYIINVAKELSINDGLLNSQLSNSPSSYSFLCMVKNHYIQLRDKLERERDEAYSEAWLYYKKSDSKVNNDMAEHMAMSNKKVKSLTRRFLKVSKKANNLIAVCRAYESRENILRTLSANLRKEQH